MLAVSWAFIPDGEIISPPIMDNGRGLYICVSGEKEEALIKFNSVTGEEEWFVTFLSFFRFSQLFAFF